MLLLVNPLPGFSCFPAAPKHPPLWFLPKQAHITVDQNFPEGQPRKIIVQGRVDACRRASTMIKELITGEPGSAQAIIQRVCAEVGAGWDQQRQQSGCGSGCGSKSCLALTARD